MLTTTKTKKVAEVTKVALRVPTEWGMYTKKGNRALTEIAKKAYDTIDKLVEEDAANPAAVRKALVRFLVAWEDLGDKKGTEEASDTAVREVVGGFHDDLWKSVFGETSADVYGIWEENRQQAYFERARRPR